MNRSIAEDGRTGPERGVAPESCPAPVSPAPSGSRRRLSLVLFLTALLFCAWFFHVGYVNQIARYDAVSAFFENTGEDAHTFRIDRYLYSEGKQMNIPLMSIVPMRSFPVSSL